MLGTNGYGDRHGPKRAQTPPGKRKHNHVVHVAALVLLTALVFYTRRSSYLNSSWDVHDRYLAHVGAPGAPGVPSALTPATAVEKKGGWAFTTDVYDQAMRHPNARVISADNPRLVHFPAFMTREEADHLVSIAKKDLHRSKVVADSDDHQTSDSRTSFGMWPPHDEFMTMIEERIHRLVGIPREFGEGMYVLNYKQGQEYKAHNDNCKGTLKDMPVSTSCVDFLKRAGGPSCGPDGGGPSCGDRIATFIIVLDPAEEGGHTAFPARTPPRETWPASTCPTTRAPSPGTVTKSTRTRSCRRLPARGTACSSGTTRPTRQTPQTPWRLTGRSTAAVRSSRAKNGS
jgi:hypothetical protein